MRNAPRRFPSSPIHSLFRALVSVTILTSMIYFLGGCIRISARAGPTVVPVTESPLPTLAQIAVPATMTSSPAPTTLPTETPVLQTGSVPIPLQPTAVQSPVSPLVSTALPEVVPESNLPQYDLHVTLDTAVNQVEVQQTVSIVNDTADVWQKLVFHVAPAYWPGLLTLHEVIVNQGEESLTVIPEWEITMMVLPLLQPVSPGEKVTIDFGYRLDLPRLDPTGWGPQGNAGWATSLIQMGDWYPALVPYRSGLGWQTWQFKAVGDPVISRLADFEVTIAAPPDIHIAAAGFAGADESGRHYRLPRARAFSFVASPHFVLFEGQAGLTPVKVYVSQEHQALGPVTLQTAISALTLFTELYGPYPYQEFVLAENGFLTGMEYSAMVSQSGFAFDTYNGTAASLLIALTAHEVAHQWWYGGVGNDQVTEPWLDESLAMLSEWLFYERYYPDLVDWWWSFRVDRWQPAGPVNATIYDFADSETFVHNMYGRAAYFLRDLRSIMGETAFRAFLRDYYREFGGQFADEKGFFTVLQNHTSADLANIRSQYFRE